MLEGKYTWSIIEQRLLEMTLNPTKLFNQLTELK